MIEKYAIVTGAASGIGRATAMLLHDKGYAVHAIDIDTEGLSTLPPSVRCWTCDLDDLETLRNVITRIDAECPALHVLVNNAGAPGTGATLAEMDFGEWDRTFALLVRAVAAGTQFALPMLRRAGGASVINIASVAAFQSGAAGIAYSTAKAGVLHFSRLAAAELARDKIRVNSVSPGLILSGIFASAHRSDPEAVRRINAAMEDFAPKAQPLAQGGRPEDIAEIIAFLASDAARFVTGANVLADGGMTIGPRHSWDADEQAMMASIFAEVTEAQALPN